MAKKKKPEKKNKRDSFYVSINSPDSVRMKILESRRSILESMKLFKHIKHLREEKITERIILRKHLSEVAKMINKIKLAMPHVVLPHEKETIKPEQKSKVLKMEKPIHRTELERIEQDLSDIESKISNL